MEFHSFHSNERKIESNGRRIEATARPGRASFLMMDFGHMWKVIRVSYTIHLSEEDSGDKCRAAFGRISRMHKSEESYFCLGKKLFRCYTEKQRITIIG